MNGSEFVHDVTSTRHRIIMKWSRLLTKIYADDISKWRSCSLRKNSAKFCQNFLFSLFSVSLILHCFIPLIFNAYSCVLLIVPVPTSICLMAAFKLCVGTDRIVKGNTTKPLVRPIKAQLATSNQQLPADGFRFVWAFGFGNSRARRSSINWRVKRVSNFANGSWNLQWNVGNKGENHFSTLGIGLAKSSIDHSNWP